MAQILPGIIAGLFAIGEGVALVKRASAIHEAWWTRRGVTYRGAWVWAGATIAVVFIGSLAVLWVIMWVFIHTL